MVMYNEISLLNVFMWGYVSLILIFIWTDVAFWLNLAYLHGSMLTNMSLLNKYIQKIKKK